VGNSRSSSTGAGYCSTPQASVRVGWLLPRTTSSAGAQCRAGAWRGSSRATDVWRMMLHGAAERARRMLGPRRTSLSKHLAHFDGAAASPRQAAPRPTRCRRRGAPSCGSPGRCSSLAPALGRLVVVHPDTDVGPAPGFRGRRMSSTLGADTGRLRRLRKSATDDRVWAPRAMRAWLLPPKMGSAPAIAPLTGWGRRSGRSDHP